MNAIIDRTSYGCLTRRLPILTRLNSSLYKKRKEITLVERLIITLRYPGIGENFNRLSHKTRVSSNTTSYIGTDFCVAIIKIHADQMQLSNKNGK